MGGGRVSSLGGGMAEKGLERSSELLGGWEEAEGRLE